MKAKWKRSVLILETIGNLKLPTDPLISGSDAFHYGELWKLSGDGQVLYVERDEPRSVFAYEKGPCDVLPGHWRTAVPLG